MGKHEDQQSEFSLQGRFLGFAAKDGYKLKYLRLSVSTGECVIKIPKEQRLMLYRTLTPGDWIQVVGFQEFCLKKGTIKMKAMQVTPTVPSGQGANLGTFGSSSVPPYPVGESKKKANILVCQKSDCCKRGGRALVEALQAELGDRGLTEQVSIKPTGCMKQCKAGPNLVMPDKTRYCRIRPGDVPTLLAKHFPVSIKPGVA